MCDGRVSVSERFEVVACASVDPIRGLRFAQARPASAKSPEDALEPDGSMGAIARRMRTVAKCRIVCGMLG